MTSLAQNRDQHLQRFHNQLTSWQEDINRLRAKAFSANSYLQGEMNKLVTQMDKRMQQMTERLVQVAEQGDRRVYDALENMESAWSTLRGNITDMMGRMREKRGGAQLQETLERGKQAVREGVEQVEETVKRGASKARQALGEQSTQAGMQGAGGTQSSGGTQTGGRRAAGAGAGETNTGGSTPNAGAGAGTRTRTPH